MWILNGVDNKVQFTLEMEKDNYLPFLDVGIMKVEEKLMTKVYRKPTHSSTLSGFQSPKKHVVRGIEGVNTQSTCAL